MTQDIGSEYLMPIAIQRMDNDIWEEDTYDGSSLIESMDFFSTEIFKRNPEIHIAILDFLNRKQTEIENIIGWKRYERIKEKTTKINNR